MVKFSDIVIEFLLLTGCFILGFIIIFSFPYFFFIPLMIYWLIHIQLKRKKIITKYVKEDFKKIGFTILSERAPKIFEGEIKVKPTILINGIPISRYEYIRKFHRIFHVKNEVNEKFEVYADITKLWNGKNIIDIKKKKKINAKDTAEV